MHIKSNAMVRKKKKNGEWFYLILKILVKGHYRERTGTAVGHHVRENESGKGGTTTCGSRLCFPDALLKFVGGKLSMLNLSLMVLLPRTLLDCNKPQGHREDVLCTVSGVRSALNLTGVSPLSHCCWVLRLLRLWPMGFFFLCSHVLHTGKELHRSGFPTQGW